MPARIYPVELWRDRRLPFLGPVLVDRYLTTLDLTNPVSANDAIVTGADRQLLHWDYGLYRLDVTLPDGRVVSYRFTPYLMRDRNVYGDYVT